MEWGADEYSFASAAEVCNSMPYELSYSPPEASYRPWVFWSRQDNELQSIRRFSFPGFDASISRNEPIKEKIKAFLQRLVYSVFLTGNSLIQLWAPVRIAEKIYLTTAEQPFSLGKFHKGLCSYRRLCLELENILIPVDVDELGGEEHNLGPTGRVFRHGIPEICHDIKYYINKECPQRDRAIELGLISYMAFPLFGSVGQHCIGVLEIVSAENFSHYYFVYSLHSGLKGFDLTFGIDFFGICKQYWNSKAANRADVVMEHIFQWQKLPFAQVWVALPNTGHMVGLDSWGECVGRWNVEYLLMKEGQGVVGKAFSSRGACFCKDISNLSINVYPLAPCARKLGLSGCFAVCLRPTDQVDHFYILEFFLPCNEIAFGNLRTFVSNLVAELRKDIGECPFQKLEERLFVEVIKVSSDQDELDSFEICDTTSPRSVSRHSEEREMMPHDSLHQYVGDTDDARNNSSADSTSTLRSALHHNQGGSRSPLKRMSRKHQIYRWSPNRSNSTNGSYIHPDSIHPTNENTAAHNIPNTTTMQDGESIMVKATCGEDILKFWLSLSAKKIDLEQQVAVRVNSPVRSFKIKYLDEENEWVSLSCDEDLKLCIDTFRSHGKTPIRMLVN